MNFFVTLLGIKRTTDELFDTTKGKTLDEYKQELLIKMGKRQFEKLNRLGLNVPVSLV